MARLQPPPVSVQNPVCNPAEIRPVVTRSQRLCRPAAHQRHGATPRAVQDSTGSTTTRQPFGNPGAPSRTSATTSCPGTNGMDTTGVRYGEDRPVSIPMSEPQMPDSSGRSRSHPSPGGLGSARLVRRSGAMLLASVPEYLPPNLVAVVL